MAKKSWIQKLLEVKDLPKKVPVPEKWTAKMGEGEMYIPCPMDIYRVMQKVPKGKVITVSEIRNFLAFDNDVVTTCPLTTGIFIWIAANASEEMAQNENRPNDLPYWRTLKSGGVLVEKYPGSIARQMQLLQNEGHQIFQKGKDFKIADLESRLVKLID